MSASPAPSYPVPAPAPASAGGPVAAPGISRTGSDLMADLRGALRALLRYRWLIVLVVGLGFAASVLLALSLPRKWEATAEVLVGAGNQTLLERTTATPDPFGNDILVESESQIILSRSIAEAAVRTMGLLYDPKLNPLLGWAADDITGTPEATREWMRARVLQSFRRDLSVRQVGRSRVIAITYRDTNPETAAGIANAVARAYLDRQVEEKRAANQATAKALTERITELRKDVAAQEADIAAYRSRADLPEESGPISVLTERLTNVTGQLTDVRTSIASLRARLAQADRILAADSGAVPGGLASTPMLEALRAQKALALSALATAEARYQPGHPAIAQAREVITSLDAQLRSELAPVRADLAVELDSAEARLAELNRLKSELDEEGRARTRAQIDLRALEREVDSARRILEDFLNRRAEVQEIMGTEQADARLVSPAIAPADPVAPNRKLIVAAGVLASGFIALLLVLWLEQTDTRLLTLEQAELWTGAPVLAALPRLDTTRDDQPPPHRMIVDRPASPFADGVRALHLALAPPDHAEPPGLITITAPDSSEGKTVVAVSLARAFALEAGLRTVLVDGNRLSPKVAQATGAPTDFGLLDLIRDGAELDQVIQQDPLTPLHVLPIAPETGQSLRLQNVQLRALARQLKDRYEAVVIDAPGLLDSPDANACAAVADSIVLVVAARRTRQARVTAAMRTLRAVETRLAGVVLNHASGLT